MKKIIIGEEEILIGENSVRQLADDELDRACGGDGVDGVIRKVLSATSATSGVVCLGILCKKGILSSITKTRAAGER
ncbi:MAG: hypothetical protein VB070_09785 [Clostridiaceae bacterium]|nr:hypothetical protein [Clostridiaceae bacterium]